MRIIFQIDGGIGKSVAATAVCKAIKRQYPNDQLFVITGYPEVFLCNPNVDRVFNFNNLTYFYQDYIEGAQVRTFLHNPYLESDFINRNGHLIQVWCEMFGIQYNGELPELYINATEQALYSSNFASQKPIMLIQTNGGGGNQGNKYSWARDLPIGVAQKVVNAMAPHYHVVHIRRNDQPALQNVSTVQAEFRAIAMLIGMSSKRLFIDSFCQHTAAALRMPSVVCWIANTPTQFGYDMHTNIIANAPTVKPDLRQSVFGKYNISGVATEFPYHNEEELFNADVLLEALMRDHSNGRMVQQQGVANPAVRQRIAHGLQQNSMVARRLQHLADLVDLENVRQIVDIGSWHLIQSIEFMQIFPNARIDAFEPVPVSFEICRNNWQLLSEEEKARISVHNIALNNEDGDIPFYEIDAETSSVPNIGASSKFKFMDGLNGTPFGQTLMQKEITVKGYTLDNWCRLQGVTAIDIMWMDVQGAELHVLQGATEILKNTRIIMTEVGLKPYYEGHTLKKDIDQLLFSLGFKELDSAFELNGFDYEANAIYIKVNNV
jgi:FkbM family methyltransferase